jgi:hypothetical protein
MPNFQRQVLEQKLMDLLVHFVLFFVKEKYVYLEYPQAQHKFQSINILFKVIKGTRVLGK